MRSLDSAADCDTFVSLGDPFPPTLSVEHDVAFVGLSMKVRDRMHQLAAAELEQVQAAILKLRDLL
jgi:hypothetical protein